MVTAQERKAGRIICLSNTFDQQYVNVRREEILAYFGIEKRRNLWRCLELASGRQLIVLSSPPKASKRRRARWLAPLETRFDQHPQFICANWDIPKLRVPLSWLFYAIHVVRYTRDGDIVLIDNYEIVYVIAAWAAHLRRKVRFILDYEDGKHLIDKGIYFVLSRIAEALGRPLLSAAVVAAPALQKRLPRNLPVELAPGFYSSQFDPSQRDSSSDDLHFLYSGSLDKARGVDLLLAAVDLLPPNGWRLHITGAGELEDQVREFARASNVCFHATLPSEPYERLLRKCHVGLNCQRVSDPISEVTFPSKVFSYLRSGLVVLSSRASDVPSICGDACFYYDDDTAETVAQSMKQIMENFATIKRQSAQGLTVMDQYSLSGTSARLRELFAKGRLV